MSLSTWCHPSFDMTGRLGSSERVSADIAAANDCWVGSAPILSTPQLSLIGTHATIDGWLRSRRTTDVHSELSRACDRGVFSCALAVSPHPMTPSRSAQAR